MPTLSIALANYNHGAVIGRAIRAILGQSRRPDQVIIVDDASTDNSVEVIRDAIRGEATVEFIQLQENTRFFGAFATAVERVRGDYVYGAGADDWVLPGFFARVMEAVEGRPGVGLILGGVRAVNSQGKVQSNGVELPSHDEWYPASDFLTQFADKYGPFHSHGAATVYRTESLRRVGGLRAELGLWSDTFAAWSIGLKEGAYRMAEDCAVFQLAEGGISGASVRNPLKMMDVAARAERLMRSPAFSEYYPAAFVNRWVKAWRCGTVDQYIHQIDLMFGEMEYGVWQGSLDAPILNRLRSKLGIRSSQLASYLACAVLRRLLLSYPGKV